MELTAAYVVAEICEMHEWQSALVLQQQSAVECVHSVAVKCTNDTNWITYRLGYSLSTLGYAVVLGMVTQAPTDG